MRLRFANRCHGMHVTRMPVVAIPTLSSKGWCIVTPEYCHQCQRITPGTAFKVSSGHIVNACAICRAARKGRPYLPQWAYELFEFENSRPMPVRRADGSRISPMPTKGRGQHHVTG